MGPAGFEEHLLAACGEGGLPDAASKGVAGGAACGDVITFRAELDSHDLVSVGWEAEGCGALRASASAASSLVEGLSLDAGAKVSTAAIARELGGVSAGKIHACELVCDALHRALGEALVGTIERRAPEPGRRLSLVAMSGGVDSAVAAVLAARNGEVAGVTVELWRDEHNDAAQSCCSHVAVRRARALAHDLGMAHFTLDLRKGFRETVVDRWVSSADGGVTVNPCVACNGQVRIGRMAEVARRLGARTLVTGHYAKLTEADDPRGPLLAGGKDPSKDQAYALMRVEPSVLAMMEFPLGRMSKAQVRAIARREGLSVAAQPDSQDLCFLAGVGRERFLDRHSHRSRSTGPIINHRGQQLGTHRGHRLHTVGQRRGLGIGGGTPLYVTDIHPETNTLVVGPRDQLLVEKVLLRDLDLRREAQRVRSVRLRHRAMVANARLIPMSPDEGLLELESPLERVAAGQLACLMDGEKVVGCGTVARLDA